MLILTVH